MLQGLVLRLCLLHGGLNVAAGGEDRLSGHGHGAAQENIDLADPGHLFIGFCQVLPVFRFPVLFGLGKSCPGALDHFFAVCHGSTLP